MRSFYILAEWLFSVQFGRVIGPYCFQNAAGNGAPVNGIR